MAFSLSGGLQLFPKSQLDLRGHLSAGREREREGKKGMGGFEKIPRLALHP